LDSFVDSHPGNVVFQRVVLQDYRFLLFPAGSPRILFSTISSSNPPDGALADIAQLCIDFPSNPNCKSSIVSIKLLEHCLCSSSVCPLNGGSDPLLHAVFTMGNNILTLDDIIQLWVGNDELVGTSVLLILLLLNREIYHCIVKPTSHHA